MTCTCGKLGFDGAPLGCWHDDLEPRDQPCRCGDVPEHMQSDHFDERGQRVRGPVVAWFSEPTPRWRKSWEAKL